MIRYGLQWQALQDYLAIEETSNSSVWGEGAAGTPPDNHVFIYAKDKSGTSGLFWKNDAGTEFDFSTMVGGSGASGRATFWTGTQTVSSDASFRWDNTNKWLGIGNSAPTKAIDVAGGTDDLTDINVRRASADTSSGGLTMLKARGSIGSEAATQSGDFLGIIGFGGFTTAAAFNKATIRALAGELWSGTASGAYLIFETTPLTTLNRAQVMRLNTDGDLWLTVKTSLPTGWQTSRGFVRLTEGTTPAEYQAGNYGAQAQGGVFRGLHSRGTIALPTQSLTNDTIDLAACFAPGTAGVDGTAGVIIRMMCAEDWTSTNRGTHISFVTTPIGSTTASRAERFRIGPSGQWGIGGATYGTANNIFKSGGASAAPSWGTINLLDSASIGDTLTGTVVRGDLIVGNSTPKWARFAVGAANTVLKSNGTDPSWLDYTTDWLTQYVLLAGRSGGQTITGGTAAGDDLNFIATSGAGVGSEHFVFKVGSNGARTIFDLSAVSAGTATAVFDSGTASKQINVCWADNGTTKWIIYKTTDNKFAFWDSVTNADILVFQNITSIPAASAAIKFGPTISNPNATTIGVYFQPTFTGAGEGPWGVSISAAFAPSANIGACYNSLNQAILAPPSGVTISGATAAYYSCTYNNVSGAVTNGYTLQCNAPSIGGALKPQSQYGILIQNQGAAGMTSAYGIRLDATSGATNNFDMSFGTVDTTAAGAYYGRVPVLYNGLLKYIHVFSA